MSMPLPDSLRDAVTEMKPKLRGWLHAAISPLAFFSFLVLLVLAEDVKVRAGAAVFMFSAVLLFGVSAVYHTGRWGERAKEIWRRFDHANIFIMIAGSYTPFALLLLTPKHAWIMLSLIWGGTLLGILFRVLWVGAPRWLYVTLYIALGWAAVINLPEFIRKAPTDVLVLIIVGGVLYTIGGLVYGLKWPNPSPRWFGFHEVFHSLTIAAFVVHYIGVSLLAYRDFVLP